MYRNLFTTLPSGVSVICWKNFKFLVSQRKTGENLFQFPGGKVEKGENAQFAARRELSEEVGWELGMKRFINLGQIAPCVGYNKELYQGHRYGVVIRPGEEVPPNPEPEKHGPWHWVSLEALHELPMLGGQLEFAAAMERYAVDLQF